MEHKAVIIIPLNADGVRGLEFPAEYKEENYRIIDVTEDDIRRLFWLFDEYNQAFDILIGSYEEETITATLLPRAIDLATTFRAGKTDPETLSSIDKLLDALRFANNLKVDIELDF